MKTRLIKNEKGFSLVEALLAIALSIAALTAFLVTFTGSQKAVGSAAKRWEVQVILETVGDMVATTSPQTIENLIQVEAGNGNAYYSYYTESSQPWLAHWKNQIDAEAIRLRIGFFDENNALTPYPFSPPASISPEDYRIEITVEADFKALPNRPKRTVAWKKWILKNL